MTRPKKPTFNLPVQAARAVADVAVQQHGEHFLTRGGPVGRARAVMARGGTAEEAVRAAVVQGKGHAAELRVSAEHSVFAALLGLDHRSQPNAIANDPHVDVEVLSEIERVSGAQLGVGSPSYLRKKAQRSLADQVVLPSDIVGALRAANDPIAQRVDDRLRFAGAASRGVTSEQAIEDATVIIDRSLRRQTIAPFATRCIAVAGSGLEAFFLGAGRNLLYGVADRLLNNRPLDETMIEAALFEGIEAGVHASVQTYLVVDRFLSQAGHVFDARLLQSMGRYTVVAGAIANVVVATCRDLVAVLRDEMTFEGLLRSMGVHVFSAAGAAGGALVALRVCRGLPWWLTGIACLVAGYAGGELGDRIGQALFQPPPPPLTR